MSIAGFLLLLWLILRLIRYRYRSSRRYRTWKPNALKYSNQRYKRFKALQQTGKELGQM